MPVIFNEPLSFLQRVVEYMEYGRLIERASASDDPIERHEVSQSVTRLLLLTLLLAGIADACKYRYLELYYIKPRGKRR